MNEELRKLEETGKIAVYTVSSFSVTPLFNKNRPSKKLLGGLFYRIQV